MPVQPISDAGPAPRSDAGGAASEEMSGTVLGGKYRLDREIARGAMGRVFLATQVALQRAVAIKLMRPQHDSAEFRRRFLLEATSVGALSHPNIVTVHDYGQTADGVLYQAMEFIDGQVLSRVLKGGALQPARALRIAAHITRALRAAHKAGIVHRDLKPSNVMLVSDEDGEHVKVLDFGLAKLYAPQTDDGGPLVDRGADMTRDGMMLGTPRYMAPEQILGEPIGPHTDVYALGGVLYHMLAGRPPFDGANDVEVLQGHLKRPPAPLSALGVPAPVDAVVQRCLAKAPSERFDSATAVLDALKVAARACPPEPALAGEDPTMVLGHGAIVSSQEASAHSLSSSMAEHPRLAPGSGAHGHPSAASGAGSTGHAVAFPGAGTQSGGATQSGVVGTLSTQAPLLVHADGSSSAGSSAVLVDSRVLERTARSQMVMRASIGVLLVVLGVLAALLLARREPPAVPPPVAVPVQPTVTKVAVQTMPDGLMLETATGTSLGRSPLVVPLTEPVFVRAVIGEARSQAIALDLDRSTALLDFSAFATAQRAVPAAKVPEGHDGPGSNAERPAAKEAVPRTARRGARRARRGVRSTKSTGLKKGSSRGLAKPNADAETGSSAEKRKPRFGSIDDEAKPRFGTIADDTKPKFGAVQDDDAPAFGAVE